MNRLTYRVGGHQFTVVFRQTEADERLLPSFAPFRCDEEPGDNLFELIVDDAFRWDERGEVVGQFDCGGCNHGVYCLPDGSYQFEISDSQGAVCCYQQANPSFTHHVVALPATTWAQRHYGLNNALMMAYAFSAAEKDTLLMHASVVRQGGKGYLCLGKSGTGKSTHTQLWLKHIPGSDLMNDDNPVVRFVDGETRVYGSPWSGKTPCYRNIEAPVGAFIRLEQKPVNTIVRERVLGAFASLLPSASNMKWDRRVNNGICNTLSHILGVTPVFLLGCRPDREAAVLCHNTVTGI